MIDIRLLTIMTIIRLWVNKMIDVLTFHHLKKQTHKFSPNNFLSRFGALAALGSDENPQWGCPISRFLCNTLSCNTTSHQKPISGEDKPHSSQSKAYMQTELSRFIYNQKANVVTLLFQWQCSSILIHTAFDAFGSLTHPLTRPVCEIWCNYCAVRNNHYQYLNLSRLEADFVSLSTFERRTMSFCPKHLWFVLIWEPDITHNSHRIQNQTNRPAVILHSLKKVQIMRKCKQKVRRS